MRVLANAEPRRPTGRPRSGGRSRPRTGCGRSALPAVLLAFACQACASPALVPPAVMSAKVASTRALPPTAEELKNATYAGVGNHLGPVTLSNGRWTGAPTASGAASRPSVELADDFVVVGDLDGDGLEEAVVLLTYSSGGTGVWSFLAVVARRNGALHNVATAPLGDRVQIRSARITGGKLLVAAVRAGANDAACCPGDLVDWQWTLGERSLNTPGAVGTGRLSLATLAGTVWILRAWDIRAPAELEPEVTLAYDAGRFTGSGGCNRYVAAVEGGVMAGEIKVGPPAATRMACPEPQSSAETRFLEQLGGARTIGFMLGRLAISYTRANGSGGTMLFDPSTRPKGL